MAKENIINNFIIDKMNSYPKCLYGIADISYSNYSSKYKCALIIAVPHGELISLDNYSEEKFADVICTTREGSDTIICDLINLFEKCNISYFVPQMAQKDEETLVAPFSFKYAAVNAGIGWIGKNGVLVTEEYRPRIRLSVILVNYDLPLSRSITNSMCDDGCFYCVEACPHKALKGVQWDISTQREDLIDYQLCNTKRSLFMKKYGRKNACGLCMVACPLGL